MPADPRPAPAQQHPASPGNDPQGPARERAGAPSARAILITDAAWDVIVGAALIASTITAVTRPLGAASLRPWPVPAVIGAGCLTVAALLLVASTGPDAAGMCRLIWRPNLLTAVAGVALLLALPRLAHSYVIGLVIVSIGCAVFGTLEWTAARQR